MSNIVKFDFIKLEQHVNNAVIKLVSLFINKEVTSIEEAKGIIQNKLLINSSNYEDYHDNNFQLMSVLYSKIKAKDYEEFNILFLSITYLIESFLKVDETDRKLCDKISKIIAELINNFEDIIGNDPINY